MKSFLLVIASVMIFALVGCVNEKDRVYDLNDLVEKANADEAGWKGREVSVSGYVSTPSLLKAPATGYSLYMEQDLTSGKGRHVACNVSQGVLPEGIRSKFVVVRGTIASVHRHNLDQQQIELEPCEILK